MNSCSCLKLIVDCIVYRQASEISRVVSQCDSQSNDIDLTLLEQDCPFEWGNVVLYGR